MAAAESIKKRAPVFIKVSALRPDTAGHNLKLKVLDSKVVVNRPSGRIAGNTPNKLAECTVGDETGSIVLTARNEQVDTVQPGKYVIVRNAKIDMFRGSMRLAVNHWGKIEEAAETLDFTPNEQNNLSLIEFELVPVPASAQDQMHGSTANGRPAAVEEAPPSQT